MTTNPTSAVDHFFRRLGGLVVGLMLIALIFYLGDVLVPFVVALLLAYIINPLVDFAERLVKRRWLAVILCLGSIILLATLALWIILPLIASEISETARTLSRFASDNNFSGRAERYLPPEMAERLRQIAASVNIRGLFTGGDAFSLFEAAVRKILPGLWNLLTGAFGVLLGIVGLAFILLYTVFLLLDFPRIRSQWTLFIPKRNRSDVVEFLSEIDGAMNRYFRAQSLIAACVGILFSIGFSIIGLPLAILLGLFLGLLNMVPYLQLLGLIPAFFLAVVASIETGTSLWTMLGLTLLVVGIVQAVQDGFLTPKIMGSFTGLSPAFILLSLAVWGKLLGFLGLLLAIPLTCIALVYYRRHLARTEEVKV